MAGLTSERDTLEISNGAKTLVLPVKGETTIYQGGIVAIDANGYALPGKLAEGLKAAGRAEETVINIGADGAATIRVGAACLFLTTRQLPTRLSPQRMYWVPVISRMTTPSQRRRMARPWPGW